MTAGRGALGILGGTFDPIHVGHLALAEDARGELGLEQVLFVPAGVPPHKRDREISPPAHRLAMVELAIAGNDAFEASRIELDRTGPSYTVDTAAALVDAAVAANHEPDIVFIVSSDALRDLPSWHEPDRLLALARLAVATRPGTPLPAGAWVAEHFPGREDRIILLDSPGVRVSGSEIRARAAAGRSIRYLVPDAVAAYITDHDLYRDPAWRKN